MDLEKKSIRQLRDLMEDKKLSIVEREQVALELKHRFPICSICGDKTPLFTGTRDKVCPKCFKLISPHEFSYVEFRFAHDDMYEEE